MAEKKVFKNILKGIKSTFKDEPKETDLPDYTLVYDFEYCKNKILERNKEEIINSFIPVIIREMLRTDGLLINEEQARREALVIFRDFKKIGAIDCMNKFIGKVDYAH